jgi:hypothetical protein
LAPSGGWPRAGWARWDSLPMTLLAQPRGAARSRGVRWRPREVLGGERYGPSPGFLSGGGGGQEDGG